MTDSSGKIAETMKYALYGLGYYDSYININGNGGIYTPYKYTGLYFDSDTSLYFYNARYYDPALGRFISADTLVGRATDPQSLNRYSYVRNNPIIYVDPSGHSLVSDFIDRQSEWLHDNGSKIGNVVAATAITAIICAATSGGGCVFAAIAAAGSTTYLETKEGKRDVAWIANRVFDNFFGIKDESLDYSLAYIGLDAGLTFGITSGYDYFSSGSATGSGTTESTPEDNLDVSPVPQPEEVRVAGGNYITGEDAWEPKGIGGNGYPAGSDNLRALPGGEAAADFNTTITVEGNLATRPYIKSPLTIQEIMKSGPPLPDPRGIPGLQYWKVPGSFNGSTGSYELLYDPSKNTILHFLYKGGK